MSELPEIESVVYFLRPHLVNRTIKKVILEKESILVNCSKLELIDHLTNRTIIDFSRRGKILIFSLDDQSKLFIHPRMVGQLITCYKEFPEIKHTHFIMEFDNDEEFRYIDVRRLGKLYYLRDGEDVSVTGINKLGLEYNNSQLDIDYLKLHLSHFKKTIKDALLDQSIITGIGNIYADEILFSAGIIPNKKAKELSDDEINDLFISIQDTLDNYIEINESVGYDEYLKGEGRDFKNMHILRLYDSEICPACGDKLTRIKISSRTTVYCPHCQK
ncbi:bifunctional DNA-formamidopyrimidine glycosylase/DNA-(apurinic or apyrimidinic site) lyase [Longibaculum muris]|uniref:Formamidopyrimidine-DNA glycosylase n=1 Tax=Longibaculum muris TaxID=1796628 RepID=A0A4R3YKA1_9FIRM|nr:bifunctional DNA-formamidopyrimidine glycosylase/DNA-(apurinic or apyrimidinic site) lyase [Longibaculum muris]KXU52278.1 putative DNA-formamidopyrimidine glycosylase [Candidatus Stoquefichus sp. KLE1796]MBS5370975.1 bifunctional DNA-formamidopyrimidine glycosylase/DNA-(apurinic or apyrimidinic site) lyase [Coprobacillus cateniformis]MCR1886755.1 bifunctional DNA-formamidopyrimidine glycosylase/DNA-(apurinic or apyrimidinic site) lyase [Longibaculum muris]TCV92917.1 DNA-(apurinic or apyrimid